MKNKQITNLTLAFALGIFINSCNSSTPDSQLTQLGNEVSIGVSSENLMLEEEIKTLTGKATKKSPKIVSKGSVFLTELACKGELDAIAIADEMWGNIKCPQASWVDTSGTLYQTRIQFALPTKTAQQLGWVNRVVTRKEVLDALKGGKLQLATTIPTDSNSGYNTLLWLTREVIGSNLQPEQITPDSLKPLQPIYQNLAASSESTSYLAEKLAQNWPSNTLAALYRFLYAPDGTALYHEGTKLQLTEPVTLIEVTPAVSVTPTWFVTTNNEQLKQQLTEGVFNRLTQEYSSKFQQLEQLNPPLPPNIARETAPTVEVHRKLLDSFHASIRQKRWIVAIVDGSGSMKGEGYTQLLSAFSELLDTQKAKENFLYSPNDRFSLIVYQGESAYSLPRQNQSLANVSREVLLQSLREEVQPSGGTPVDLGLMLGFKTALTIPSNYKTEIFLFTDGQFDNPISPQLLEIYQSLQTKAAEVTIVGAGDVDAPTLQKLAATLDARPIISQNANQTLEELLKAFREAQI